MKAMRLLVIGTVAVVLAAVPYGFGVDARPNGPSRDDLALLNGVMRLVERAYVHQVKPDELTGAALKGMLNRLDPHSDYMDEQEFKESLSDISGKFGGLGIEITQEHGVPKIVSPIDGTPAADAGLQPGDLIVQIEGKSTQGLNLTEIVHQLRGKPGTGVTITIARGNEAPFDVTIVRNIIEVQTVKSRIQRDGYGYVRITQFGGETPRKFKEAVLDLKRQGGGNLKGLVLDLRNDPGGLLEAAVDVAGNFLNGGTVVTIKGRNQEDNQAFSASPGGDLLPGTPIVVLINGASASASEIVAGALQDRGRAKVMGTQSFGKGSVQTIIPLNGRGALRLTTALYYTPGGRSIQGQGIAPDIVVEAPKEQQVAGSALPRENTLRGAFRNPGALRGSGEKGDAKKPEEVSKKTYSAPIKTQLIGSPEDAQLNAALSYLEQASPRTTGKG